MIFKEIMDAIEEASWCANVDNMNYVIYDAPGGFGVISQKERTNERVFEICQAPPPLRFRDIEVDDLGGEKSSSSTCAFPL